MEWPFFGTELQTHEDLEPTFVLRNSRTGEPVCHRCGRVARPFQYLNEGDALVAVCGCCYHVHGIEKYLRDPSLLPAYTWAVEQELRNIHWHLACGAVERARWRQSQGAQPAERRADVPPPVATDPPSEPEREESD